MEKLIRITTVPVSLKKLLEGQLAFMSNYYDVIAVSADKQRLEEYARTNNIRFFQVELTRTITIVKDIYAVYQLWKFLKTEKPLIVHTHTPKAGIVGMLAAKLAGVPIRLHTVAGLPLLEANGGKRKILNFVEKLTYSLATKVYPNSHGLKKIILQQGLASKEKMKVLGRGSSNGIDTKYFNPSYFSEIQRKSFKIGLGIPVSDLVYIFVGRLVSDKGINELVEAFLLLNEEITNISLLLVGPYEGELDPLKKETLKTIRNHPKIFSRGYEIDVRPFFAISDILVFPSYREGFPNVVMQAGAMSLPAIVSDINGCNEIITEGKNGFVVPAKNLEILMDRMKRLIEDSELRIQFGKLARLEIIQKYERQEFWNVLLKEYKNLEGELMSNQIT